MTKHPQDFYNKKKYLNQLLSNKDFPQAIIILKDYIEEENHWFWQYSLGLVYFELKNLSKSLICLETALSKIETNNKIIQKIVLKIFDIFILHKDYTSANTLLKKHLSKTPVFFDIAERLYVSCALQVNFTDFYEYFDHLRVFKISNDQIKSLITEQDIKKFIYFLIQENELILAEDFANFSFLKKILTEDSIEFIQAETLFLTSNYPRSKKLFIKLVGTSPNKQIYKFLAELYRMEGDKFNAFKYSILYMRSFPHDFSLIRTIAYMHSFKKKNHHFIKTLRSLLNKNQHDIHLNYAMGKIYEDLKDYNVCMSYFKTANQIQDSKVTFEKSFLLREVNYYKECFDLNFYDKNKNSGYSSIAPIFIVGLPRSGSTIIEEILSREPSVMALSEIKTFKSNFKYFFNIYDPQFFKQQVQQIDKTTLVSIGKKYHQDLINKLDGRNIFTDKMLFNYAYLPLIKSSFSNAKIIITDRNYKDIFISIYKNFFSDPLFNFAYKEEHIVDIIKIYNNTIKHWKDIMGNDLLFVKYKDIVENPESTFSNIFQFCELKWQSRFLTTTKIENKFIDTASFSQARKNIYKESLDVNIKYENIFKNIFDQLNQLSL